MRFAALVWVLLLLFAPRLSAQAAPPQDTRAAYRELISKALQEYSLGHWAEARVYFADAHAIWPNARTLRGLGMVCYEARAYDESIGFLQRALDNPVQPLPAKLAVEARDLLEQAKRFVGRVVVEVNPSIGTVTIDSKPLEVRADGSVFVNPGEHQLDVTASGYQPTHREFVVDAGQHLRLYVELNAPSQERALGPSGPSRPSRPNETETESVSPQVSAPEPRPTAPPTLVLENQQPVVALVLSGLGLAAIGTGWAYYAVHNDARLSLWRHMILSDEPFDSRVVQRYRTSEAIALAGAAGGSLLLSMATYFWLPDDPDVPAWAVLAGTVGVAIGVTALVFALGAKHCDLANRSPDCQQVSADRSFAPMLALQALPFLSLPLMYAVRPRTYEQQTALSLSWVNGPYLRLAGRF
jgi:hypothetical protein